MAITIYGSQVVFPDSSVQTSGNKLLNFQRITYGGRQTWTQGTENTYWSFAVNKLNASSSLYVEVHLSMRTNYSDCLVHACNYAGSGWFQGTQAYNAGFTANSRPFLSTFYLTGITATGSNTMNLRWYTANNQAGNAPAVIWNPNSSDDARYTQEYSAVQIYEIL